MYITNNLLVFFMDLIIYNDQLLSSNLNLIYYMNLNLIYYMGFRIFFVMITNRPSLLIFLNFWLPATEDSYTFDVF